MESTHALAHPLAEVAEQAKTYLAATAASTRRAYRHDWLHFEQWCAQH